MNPRSMARNALERRNELTTLVAAGAQSVAREAASPDELLPRCYDLMIERNLGLEVFVMLAEEVQRLTGWNLANSDHSGGEKHSTAMVG